MNENHDNQGDDFRDFFARSEGNVCIGQNENGEYPFNKKELKNWRIIYALSYIIWFFFGGEIIGDSVGIFLFLISFGIPYFLMHEFVYKTFYFKKIYGIEWSKSAEEYRLGKTKREK